MEGRVVHNSCEWVGAYHDVPRPGEYHITNLIQGEDADIQETRHIR